MAESNSTNHRIQYEAYIENDKEMRSKKFENQMISLEEKNSIELKILNTTKEDEKFFQLLNFFFSECSDKNNKIKCINKILGHLKPSYEEIEQLLIDYKKNFFENSDFAKEILKNLLAKYLEKFYLYNQFPHNDLWCLQNFLRFWSDGEIDILTYYISYVRNYIDSSHTEEAIKVQMLKLLKVFKTISEESMAEPFELTNKNITLYEDIAHFLKVCYDSNQMDSEIITTLLKIIFKMHLKNAKDSFIIKHIDYNPHFLNYILNHCDKEELNLKEYVSNYRNTIWSYHSNLSIINAAALGDVESLQKLLDYGFEIYPNEEQQNCNFRIDKIPKHHQIILEVMKKSIKKYQEEFGDLNMSQEQKNVILEKQVNCFRIIWEEIPFPEVTANDLHRSIENAFDYLNLKYSGSLNGHRIEKRQKNVLIRLAHHFEKYFCIATKREPCPLQKFCRIQIRKLFRDALKCPKNDQTFIDIFDYCTRFESELFQPSFEKWLIEFDKIIL